MQSVPTYKDYLYLIDSLKSYASPKAKLTSLIKSGNVLKIRRGLYIDPTDNAVSLKTLANKIYGPSYISFEFALAYYGLIPERVQIVTSASMNKNKRRIFQTPVGAFSYNSISCKVFPYGVVRLEENQSPFLIASREKALCDTLSKTADITSIGALKTLLFEDLRIDREEMDSLSVADIELYVFQYRKKTPELFLKYLKGR